jgi:uncharacterized OsmC-like protein
MRPVGAEAVLTRFGRPQVQSDMGGALDVVTAASEPGFNPLDLLFSSLAACLVLSARIAASRLGLIGQFAEARVHVTGEKSSEEPFRIQRLFIDLTVEGDLDQTQKMQISRMAEEICTVSNTLRSPPELVVTSH